MQSRADVVSQGTVAYYHCTSRCVRRAFLCGVDSYSGKNFEHRRIWIKERLSLLLSAFAVELAAYAIMSNHLHSVLRTRPDLVSTWTDQEVVRRWLIIFPRPLRVGDEDVHLAQQIEALASETEKVAKYRTRLSSISWFNRCLNERIARRANSEDQVTGRFWEGRFKCQLLKDERALVTCSVYVDLNQIRAGVAKTPETSDFTSVQQRIQEHTDTALLCSSPASLPLLSLSSMFCKKLSFADYITLVDRTARIHVQGKHSLSPDVEPILVRLGISTEQWNPSMNSRYSTMFRRIVGTADQIRQHALENGRYWFHGLSSAKSLFSMT